MSAENIVKKWGSCRYSLAFGFLGDDEAGHALADEGYNENYACKHASIVSSRKYPTAKFTEISYYPHRIQSRKAAILYGTGKIDDPKVIEALNRSCGKCPFYKKDPSKT